MILNCNKKKYLVIIAIFAFILYQLINFIYFPIATTFPDEGRFLTEAIKFANTGEFWVGNSRAWEMPLTGVFYGVVYKTVNNIEYSIILIRILQSFMLILQASLIYSIALILFNKKEVAFISFVAVLFYPFFIFYQALLLSETLFITILIISFYFLYKWYETGFELNKYFMLMNVFFTLSLYSKGTLSFLPPLLISLFYLLNTYNLKRGLKIFLLSFLIYTILMSGWWIRNYILFDSVVFFTTSSASNLYLGANENNKEGGIHWVNDVNLKFVKKVNSVSNELEKNSLYKQKAIEFIKQNPMQYVGLMWLKFKRFYNFSMNAAEYNSFFYNIISLFTYGLSFIFALATFLLKIKDWEKFSAIYLLIGYFTLIHIIFIASIRYRLPLEPFFILLAANSIVLLKEKIICVEK